MRKSLLSRKPSQDWVPQLHPTTGEAYFFNLATGEVRREHPHTRQADAVAERQRRLAHAQMDERFARIAEYKRGVEASAQGVREDCARRAEELREELVRLFVGQSTTSTFT